MANIVVVGAQWGDEAKGKIVDYLAEHAGAVVRYGGGSNAGHTVTLRGETYKFHLVPCGVLHPHVTCVIADGVVVDPSVLVKEIEGLIARGVSVENLKISNNAHVILPYHRLIDQLDETLKGGSAIGTTGRGIGPVYADKAARVGIRMHELVNPERFAARLKVQLDAKNKLLTRVYETQALDYDAILEEYNAYAEKLRPFVCDTFPIVGAAARNGRGVVFEGAQGTLLDLDLGTYPYVTSSHPIAGGACLGTGIGPTAIDQVIGVAKSYTTRVGAGAFPTELTDATGDAIREKGREYGTTTGRPRRCGWLDSVVLRYSAQINGLSALSLGHLDVLSGIDPVKICVAYRAGDTELRDLPCDLANRTDIEPIYEELPGWTEDVTGVASFADLPANCRNYVARVQELSGVPVQSVSVGPGREEILQV